MPYQLKLLLQWSSANESCMSGCVCGCVFVFVFVSGSLLESICEIDRICVGGFVRFCWPRRVVT